MLLSVRSMRKAIKTYEDLVLEEKRLQGELASYKVLIKEDIAGLKASLNPIKKIVTNVKNFFTFDDNGPLLNFGLNFGFDVLLRKILLARTGWLTKVVVPYLVKNYASHLITESQRKSLAKSISKVFSKILMKKKKEPMKEPP